MSVLYHSVQQLPLFPSDETPLKECTTCPNSYPATAEYFYRDGDRLTTQCKKCKDGRRTIRYVTVVCAECGKESKRRKSNYVKDLNKYGVRPMYCSQTCVNNARIGIKWPDSIGDEYLAGATTMELAKKYGATAKSVWDQLQRLGVQTRHGGRKGKKYGPPKHPCLNKPKHTEVTKQKIRQSAYKRIDEGKVSLVSKLEDRVAQELSDQGYVFIRQRGISYKGRYGACVDFMLIDGTAIEVNGTFWHCDPRAYPNGPVRDRQREHAERDKVKKQILAELNIPLIILWEIDLEKGMPGTIQQALATHVAPSHPST